MQEYFQNPPSHHVKPLIIMLICIIVVSFVYVAVVLFGPKEKVVDPNILSDEQKIILGQIVEQDLSTKPELSPERKQELGQILQDSLNK